MKSEDLKRRTKQFALRVIRMTDSLPRRMSADVLGRQVLRSATSVAANYRAACRGKSKADFIAKLAPAEEEADETVFWFEMIAESELLPAAKLAELRREANELTAIAVSSIRTTRRSLANSQSAVRNPKSA
ncbi:MAG: four helix bundle protein [Opitutus sp.]|nr:four helix bundle protein [Opitutus sp.]